MHLCVENFGSQGQIARLALERRAEPRNTQVTHPGPFKMPALGHTGCRVAETSTTQVSLWTDDHMCSRLLLPDSCVTPRVTQVRVILCPRHSGPQNCLPLEKPVKSIKAEGILPPSPWQARRGLAQQMLPDHTSKDS